MAIETADTTNVSIPYARKLLEDVFTAIGYKPKEAVKIADHLIDAELRGYGIAGLSRALSILEFIQAGTVKINSTTVERHGPSSACIDGHNGLGYVVGYEATNLAIEIAKESGVAVVAAKNTVFTGMLSYWAEMATSNNLVAIISSSTNPLASPPGTTQALLGTNPFCIALPSSNIPIIYDIGTSSSTYGEIKMHQRLNKRLRPGVAFDKHGNPTTDPNEALEGTFSVRDGALGTGLSIIVQLMGVMAGAPALPSPEEGFGFVITLIDPKLFGDFEVYKSRIDEYVKMYNAAPVKEGERAPRIPFARSYALRKETRERGEFEVFKEIVQGLEGYRRK